MARATGVQISGSAVRVLDLEGSGKKFKVRGYAESAVSSTEGDDRVAALGKALREAFKASKASREHVILGLATRDCILREITIPFSNEEQIAKDFVSFGGWLLDYDEARAKAAEEGKLLFTYFSRSYSP